MITIDEIKKDIDELDKYLSCSKISKLSWRNNSILPIVFLKPNGDHSEYEIEEDSQLANRFLSRLYKKYVEKYPSDKDLFYQYEKLHEKYRIEV